MGDYLDKETKQFLLIFAGITIFLIFFYPKISGSLIDLDFSNALAPITSTTSTAAPKSITTIDQTKDYSATVKTDKGDFEIDLFEDSAPKNVSNFITVASTYANASVASQTNFLFKVDVKSEPKGTVEDEINADYLMLDRTKVGEAAFLRQLYDADDASTNVFSSENLNKYSDFTLKEFYSEVLKYSYNPEVTTPKATKYMVYMASNGPDKNNVDFFVLLAGNAPQVDGRYTPIGQVTKGFEVIDEINESPTSKVQSVTIKTK